MIRAAARWLEHLASSDIARTRALFTSHRAFNDLTPTQYSAALAWLQDKGLLDQAVPKSAISSILFETAITDALWFNDADVLVNAPSDIPGDALDTAHSLGLSIDDAYAAIRHIWGKVDTAERTRIGSAGEHALLELLAASADATVRHVAAESDGYGYDIQVVTGSHRVHLEVKSTTRRGRLRFYLSRHEYETMRRDPAWTLAAVRLSEELQIVALATVDRDWLLNTAPNDRWPGARWESLRTDVPADVLVPGVRSLVRPLPPPHDPRLLGIPEWPG